MSFCNKYQLANYTFTIFFFLLFMRQLVEEYYEIFQVLFTFLHSLTINFLKSQQFLSLSILHDVRSLGVPKRLFQIRFVNHQHQHLPLVFLIMAILLIPSRWIIYKPGTSVYMQLAQSLCQFSLVWLLFLHNERWSWFVEYCISCLALLSSFV